MGAPGDCLPCPGSVGRQAQICQGVEWHAAGVQPGWDS